MVEKEERPKSGCPMHSVAPSELTYNDYLRVSDLLSLQVSKSDPPHHDELLFIIIHQAYELWFKLILHEIDNAIRFMNAGKVLRAQHFVNRSVQIVKLLVQQIHILETMEPIEFLHFRDHLMPASGFQSTQFREIEFAAGLKDEKYLEYFKNRPEFLDRLKQRLNQIDLRSAYYDLLRKQGFEMPEGAGDLERRSTEGVPPNVIQAILPIYQTPSDHLELYLLSESLVEFDEYLGLWREHHVRVVERVIGSKQGTGGSQGVGYLRTTTSKKCFPSLWEVRTHLKFEPSSQGINVGL